LLLLSFNAILIISFSIIHLSIYCSKRYKKSIKSNKIYLVSWYA